MEESVDVLFVVYYLTSPYFCAQYEIVIRCFLIVISEFYEIMGKRTPFYWFLKVFSLFNRFYANEIKIVKVFYLSNELFSVNYFATFINFPEKLTNQIKSLPALTKLTKLTKLSSRLSIKDAECFIYLELIAYDIFISIKFTKRSSNE